MEQSELWLPKLQGSFFMGLAIAAAVGLYDGIVGWKISIVLKANLGKLGELVDEEEMNQMDVGTIIITVVLPCCVVV